MVTKDNKPVPVKLIASFKRMRRFKDHATIVAALKESEIMEVGGDEGDETIKRKNALDLERVTKDAPTTDIIKGDKVRTVHDKALLTSMYAVCGPSMSLSFARSGVLDMVTDNRTEGVR